MCNLHFGNDTQVYPVDSTRKILAVYIWIIGACLLLKTPWPCSPKLILRLQTLFEYKIGMAHMHLHRVEDLYIPNGNCLRFWHKAIWLELASKEFHRRPSSFFRGNMHININVPWPCGNHNYCMYLSHKCQRPQGIIFSMCVKWNAYCPWYTFIKSAIFLLIRSKRPG